jgi:hypothetical protein
MITATANKTDGKTMTRGGKRPGAGRPKGEPTKTVRVVEQAAHAAPALAAHFLRVATEAFCEQYAKAISDRGLTPVIRLTGIEETNVITVFGQGTTTVLVAVAEMDGIRCTFSVQLDGTDFFARAEDEI